MKVNVIVCGPAVGKTYLAKHDNRFVDLDQERAIYKYNLYGSSDFELEAGKLNRGEVSAHDTKEFVIRRLYEEIKKGKCVLLSHSKFYVNYLQENNIPYCLVYPGKNLAVEYAKRMKMRGNVDKFIQECARAEVWEKLYEENKNDTKPAIKIELKAGQYLSDIIEQII